MIEKRWSIDYENLTVVEVDHDPNDFMAIVNPFLEPISITREEAVAHLVRRLEIDLQDRRRRYVEAKDRYEKLAVDYAEAHARLHRARNNIHSLSLEPTDDDQDPSS